MKELSLSVTLRYIAFLRAINVGGHTVKMEHLRSLFETMGFAQVETFIASGNVIFSSPQTDTPTLEQQIETHLQQSLGYSVATFIRTLAELETVSQYVPFPADELDPSGNTLYIAFLSTPPTQAVQDKLMALQTAVDSFHTQGREIYWLCRKKMMESTFSGALLEKTIGASATLRNITTVRKIALKYPALSLQNKKMERG